MAGAVVSISPSHCSCSACAMKEVIGHCSAETGECRPPRRELSACTASNDGVTLHGVSYDRGDVIEFDPLNQTSGLFFDGGLIGGDNPDLQGFAVLDDGNYLLAAFNGGADAMTLGGLTFSRDDIVRYDPSSGQATLLLEGMEEFSAPGEIIDAVTVVAIPEPAMQWLLMVAGLLFLPRR